MARYDLTAMEVVQPPRPIWPLVAATLATLIAAPVYLLLLDVPFIRSTGLPMFLLAGMGAAAAGIYSRSDDRAWVRLLGAANGVGIVIAAIWFFWLASLPAPDPKANTLAQAPDFRLPDQDGQQITLSALYKSGPVLLVFYRGSWCPFCVSELRGLSGIYDDIRKAGVRVLTISVDAPRHSQLAVERLGLKFPLLSDVDKKVIQDYGVVHHGGGPDGSDIALPAHFLIDQQGRIVWRRVAGRLQDRADPQEILRIARENGQRT